MSHISSNHMSNSGRGRHPDSALEIIAPSPLIFGGTKNNNAKHLSWATTTIAALPVLSPSWQGDRGGPEANVAHLERVEPEAACPLLSGLMLFVACPWIVASCLDLLLISQNKVVAYITISYLWLLRLLNSCQHFSSGTFVLKELSLSPYPNFLLACSLIICLCRWVSLCDSGTWGSLLCV